MAELLELYYEICDLSNDSENETVSLSGGLSEAYGLESAKNILRNL